MTQGFVVGYDPGGKDAHGVAALEVREGNLRWIPSVLHVNEAKTLGGAVSWIERTCRGGRIVAVGIDTLTEWNSGVSGWRSADLWLRRKYPLVVKSVVAPNSIYGSMAINGAAFLTILGPRFRSDGTMVTEVHPKVCFFALTGKKHAWIDDDPQMWDWLLAELGIESPDFVRGKGHHFDAGMAVMAALRGLNGDWKLDLHSASEAASNGPVRFFGETHYWWPHDERSSRGGVA